MNDWKQTFGTQTEEPQALDFDTSPSRVYQRRNIERVTREDASGGTVEGYQYEERELTPEEYNVQELAAVMAQTSVAFVALAQNGTLDDVTITEHADAFITWSEEWTGKAGTIVRDEGKLYRAIHDIGAGQNCKPSETPSVWTRIGDPAEEWPEWIQPLGAHDAYQAGAKVNHNGKNWNNIHGDGNTWEPGVYGWKEAE